MSEETGSPIFDSMGRGGLTREGSFIVIRFERAQTDNDIQNILRKCHRELEADDSGRGFFFAMPEWDTDSRELWDIPDAIAFAKRLERLGVMSVLNCKMGAGGQPLPMAGAWELWAIARGMGYYDIRENHEAFTEALGRANEIVFRL